MRSRSTADRDRFLCRRHGRFPVHASSYRHFAVNEDNSTQRNLWSDWGDIFASTANYLQLHGWRYGEPVLAEAQYSEAAELLLSGSVSLGET